MLLRRRANNSTGASNKMPKGSGESKREGKGQFNEILLRRRANNNTDASNEINVDENSVEGRNDHGGNQG